MRLVLTIALYLGYIRAFCDYLLTGQFDWLPADPAGMLAHAAQLDQVLARPDGLVLCGLFALGCYGVAGCLANVLRDIPAWLFHAPTHVDYDLGRGLVGKMRDPNSAPAARDNAAPSA
jgi:predicted DNA repair protein MutK